MQHKEHLTKWSTDNLQLAAFLWSCNFKPQAVPASNPRKVDFQFEHSQELDDAITAFVDGSAKVNPVSFDLLRDQLHQMIREVQGGRR